MTQTIEQINSELVAACNQLTSAVENKMDEINASLGEMNSKASAAILPLGNNKDTYYVDAVAGDDNNSGVNTLNPFKTLDHAIDIASAPEMRGKRISIYVEGGSDYHISRTHDIYYRDLYISARQSYDRFNLYVEAKIDNENFACYGVGLFQSLLGVANANIYLPLFSDINGHDGQLNHLNSGLIRTTNSTRVLYVASCAIYSGDQPLIIPADGDVTSIALNSVTIGRRAGATISPIVLKNNNPITLNLKNISLNDGLLVKEGSLITGVKFQSGIPLNVKVNTTIAEAN